MKLKIFSLGLLMSLSFFALAQEKAKASIGLTFSSFGSTYITNSARMSLVGEASYRGKSFHSVGISYVHPVRSWIGIESGIEYSNHTITVEPMAMPNIMLSPVNKDISLINIPIAARINFLKYFFIHGGVLLDVEIGTSSPIDNQTGIGTLLGIGAKYNLNNGLGAFVNVYYKYHSLIPFLAESNEYRWRLVEGGLKVGVSYSF